MFGNSDYRLGGVSVTMVAAGSDAILLVKGLIVTDTSKVDVWESISKEIDVGLSITKITYSL